MAIVTVVAAVDTLKLVRILFLEMVFVVVVVVAVVGVAMVLNCCCYHYDDGDYYYQQFDCYPEYYWCSY